MLIYPLARILALIASAPVFGNKQIPMRVKLGFSLILTLVIAPTITIPSDLDPASAQGIFVLVQQMAAGLMMGFSIRLIFAAVEMAGDIAGMQMGLGFASFYDPVNASYSPVIAQFLGVLTGLAFLALNLHLYMLEALAASFSSFPISAAQPSANAFRLLAEQGGMIFAFALQLSIPLIGALLITNLALGILTRSAPQLNIFAVGFPITLAVGFGTLALVMPFLAPLIDYYTHLTLENVERMMVQLASP